MMNFVDKKKFSQLQKKSKSNFSLSKKLDYISRIDAVEDKDFFKDNNITQAYLTRDEAIEKNLWEDSYGNIMYFDRDGAVYDKDIKKRWENIHILEEHEKLEDMCLYQQVISFDDDTTKLLRQKFSQNDFFNVVDKSVTTYLLDNKFDLDNVKYFMALHTNTDNFHIHVDFVEIEPSRVKNKLDINSFDKMKRNITFEIDTDLYAQYRMSIDGSNKEHKLITDKIKDIYNVENKYKEQFKHFSKAENPKQYNKIKNIELKEFIDEIYETTLYENIKVFEEHVLDREYINSKIYGDDKSRAMTSKTLRREENDVKNLLLKKINNYDEDSELKFEITNLYLRNKDLKKQKKLLNAVINSKENNVRKSYENHINTFTLLSNNKILNIAPKYKRKTDDEIEKLFNKKISSEINDLTLQEKQIFLTLKDGFKKIDFDREIKNRTNEINKNYSIIKSSGIKVIEDEIPSVKEDFQKYKGNRQHLNNKLSKCTRKQLNQRKKEIEQVDIEVYGIQR